MAEEKYIMYILVNSDIKMKPGKTVSQACHVVQVITEKIITNAYELPTEESMIDFSYYKQWVKDNSFTKVVLKATTDELIQLIECSKTSKIKLEVIEDTYRTEQKHITAVAFYPRNDLKEMMSHYKLLE